MGRENFQIPIFSNNFTPHPNWSSKTRTPIQMCVVVIVVVVIVVVVVVVADVVVDEAVVAVCCFCRVLLL